MPSTVVSAEQFVRAWARSTNLSDMVRLTGLNRSWIKKRAKRMRKSGVDLPRFRNPRHLSPDRLNREFKRVRQEVLRAELAELERGGV